MLDAATFLESFAVYGFCPALSGQGFDTATIGYRRIIKERDFADQESGFPDGTFLRIRLSRIGG